MTAEQLKQNKKKCFVEFSIRNRFRMKRLRKIPSEFWLTYLQIMILALNFYSYLSLFTIQSKVKALRQNNPGKYENVACIRTNAMKYLPNFFEKVRRFGSKSFTVIPLLILLVKCVLQKVFISTLTPLPETLGNQLV